MYAQLVTRSSPVSRSSSTEAAVLKSSRINTIWINVTSRIIVKTEPELKIPALFMAAFMVKY